MFARADRSQAIDRVAAAVHDPAKQARTGIGRAGAADRTDVGPRQQRRRALQSHQQTKAGAKADDLGVDGDPGGRGDGADRPDRNGQSGRFEQQAVEGHQRADFLRRDRQWHRHHLAEPIVAETRQHGGRRSLSSARASA